MRRAHPASMAQVSAYLRRNGDCREMMEFYRDCLGGRLDVTRIRETPVAKDFPEPMQDKVMHARLAIGSASLMGSDLPDPAGHQPGRAWALTLDCSSEQELRTIFERLSKGGTVHQPPSAAFWSGLFGLLTDRFDVDWMLNYQAPSPKT